MIKLIHIVLMLVISLVSIGQGRLVLNNNIFINIENSAYLVIDNPNANALTTAGTGGNIVSEDELDVVQWNVGTTTGTYTLPWTTLSGIKIPTIIDISTAGAGSGVLELSTYETSTDMNTPWPTNVTDLDNNGTDNSLMVIDRFWRIDTANYTTNPTVTVSFGYDDGVNEIGGGNGITEANLQAQRWNSTSSGWEGLLYGTVNTTTNVVSGVGITPTSFFPTWTLVDMSSPLPVVLVSFDANCNREETELNWVTQTEINNDYFVLEKSYDGIVFFELETIQGAGNSSLLNNYTVIDKEVTSQIAYYRLKQVDFDGGTTYHEIISSNCKSGGFEVNNLSLNNGTLKFNISATAPENITVSFYDYTGKIISNQLTNIDEGNNIISVENLNLSTSIYMLSIIGEQNKFTTKIYGRH
jgi:hypothetical protein